MADHQVRFEELITALKSRNFRLTPQRVELVRLIAASEGHPNAARLYTTIRTRFPTMSLATVYKTLALLKELNQVVEIELHDDRHYDGNRPQPHPHLVCLKCSRILDAELDLEPATLRKLEENTGFKITRPQITLYGLCPDCKEKK
jgi:Fur family transcriptional regulator, peroxide stress response regulator